MGRDKAFIEVDGVPLWRTQLNRIEQLAPAQIFIAGPEHRAWSECGYEIIADARPEVGPLGGVVAGLRRCTSKLLLVLAVDLPLMNSTMLQQLLNECFSGVGVVGTRADRYEPLAAVYPTGALMLAEEALQLRDYSMQKFAARCVDAKLMSTRQIKTAEEQLFLNANTPADLLATQ